jgi:hypothetical protein
MTESKLPAIRFAWIREQLGLENPAEIETRSTIVMTVTGIVLTAMTGFIFLTLLPARNNEGALLFLILMGVSCFFASTLFLWGCAALCIKKAATRKPPAAAAEAPAK